MTTHSVNRGLANVFASPCNFADLNQPECSTQVTLNHPLTVLEETPGFCRVRMSDTYTGWMRASDLSQLSTSPGLEQRVVTALFTDLRSALADDSEVITRVTLGTTLHVHGTGGKVRSNVLRTVLPDGRIAFVNAADTASIPQFDTVEQPEMLAAQALAQAKKMVGSPYFWGGTTPFGIDCSGLVQLSYRVCGVAMLRDARMQFNDERFDRLPQTDFEHDSFKAGDLLFFRGVSSQKITHVGMALGDDRFVHASPYSGESHVVIEKRAGNRYAHRFVAATRLGQSVSAGLLHD